jgi:predicted esterase
MCKKISVITYLLLIITSAARSTDWHIDLARAFNDGYENLAESDVRLMMPADDVIENIAKKIPSADVLLSEIGKRDYQQPESRGELQSFTMTGIDGVVRPWVLYTPETYRSQRATPLIIALHGGVSRAEITDNPEDWAKNSGWLKMAEDNGWFAMFPFGQAGATWWDDVGMTNIRRQMQLVKHHFNIDDDRVYMAGFSDGASAGFLHAMVKPDDYAAVIALCGHMGVGSLSGELPTYAPNMANTPIYVVTTSEDGLYPTDGMRPGIDMAISAGADIFYRQRHGTHRFDFADTELPLIAAYIERHPRNPFPAKIYWETAKADFGRCRWLEITRVLPQDAAEWHIDHNQILVSKRITIGFMPDSSQETLKVESVVEKSYADTIGLKPGDIIVEAAGMTVGSLADFDVAKHGANRGDRFDMTVMRDGERVELKGILPAGDLYYLFGRTVPSAAVKALQSGNIISIEGSRVGAIKILVFPQQLNLNKNIQILYNGELVFDEQVKPDVAFILRNYLLHRDKTLLPVAEINLEPNHQ